MTTEQALLAAIWESPHDDLPRLVDADWLDESGDPAKAAALAVKTPHHYTLPSYFREMV